MHRRRLITATTSLTAATVAGCLPTAGQPSQIDSETSTITTYGFESGLNGWTPVEDAFGRTDSYASEGSYSAGIESGGSIDTIAVLDIPEENRIQRISFAWKEFTGSFGGGLLARNRSGTLECFVGSDNPEWVVIGDNSSDGPGALYVEESENVVRGYDRWIETEIEFNWDTDQFTVTYEDTESDITATDTFPLNEGESIGQLELHGYTAVGYEPGDEPETGSCQMYWDTIEIEFTGEPIPGSSKSTPDEFQTNSENGLASTFSSNSPLLVRLGGIGAVLGTGALAGGIYWIRNQNEEKRTSGEPTKEMTPTESTPAASPPSETDPTELRAEADELTEQANAAREAHEYQRATELYDEAHSLYTAAVEKFNDEDTITELEATAERVAAERSTTSEFQALYTDLQDTLERAEGSYQTAIAAHVTGESTVARLRYRQARDKFQTAWEHITDTDITELATSIEVIVSRERELKTTELTSLVDMSPDTIQELAHAGIETIPDLQDSPATVDVDENIDIMIIEELQTDNIVDNTVAQQLTALYFWHDQETYSFEDIESITTRLHQATAGYNMMK